MVSTTAVAGVLLSVYGFFHARHLTVKKYQIQLGEKKYNKKLVLLSDIHTGSFVNEKIWTSHRKSE